MPRKNLATWRINGPWVDDRQSINSIRVIRVLLRWRIWKQAFERWGRKDVRLRSKAFIRQSEVKRREENIIQKFFLFHVGFRYDDYLRKWWYTIECRKRDLRTLFVSNLNNSNFRYRGKHSRSPAISILRFIPRDTRRSLFTPVSRSSEIYLFFELFWEKVRKINKLVFL